MGRPLPLTEPVRPFVMCSALRRRVLPGELTPNETIGAGATQILGEPQNAEAPTGNKRFPGFLDGTLFSLSPGLDRIQLIFVRPSWTVAYTY
jgi:hypothetical protein